MTTEESISTRQSTRVFDGSPIAKKEIEAILKAGFEAPSAMNRRPYELVVNTDNAFWDTFKDVKPSCSIAAKAALTILVVGDSNKNPTNEFMIEDASTVSENMLLEATSLGYGSLWCGIKFESDFYKRLISYFGLPDGFIPVSLILVGKPAPKKTIRDRYEEKKIHYGKF